MAPLAAWWMVIRPPPPPRPDMYGSTTLSAAAVATAPSTAFPPSIKMRSPAVAASPWAALTAPRMPTDGGRYAPPCGPPSTASAAEVDDVPVTTAICAG
jgi:hypothetical protein